MSAAVGPRFAGPPAWISAGGTFPLVAVETDGRGGAAAPGVGGIDPPTVVVGAVAGMLHVVDCEKTKITAAARRILVSNSCDVQLNVFTPSPPLLVGDHFGKRGRVESSVDSQKQEPSMWHQSAPFNWVHGSTYCIFLNCPGP